jgi:hypothetical protein
MVNNEEAPIIIDGGGIAINLKRKEKSREKCKMADVDQGDDKGKDN